METLIEVGYKEGVFDATGEGIKKDILDLDIKGIKEVSARQLYLVEGKLPGEKIRIIAERILCDPVHQYYKVVDQSASPGGGFSVEVWFKKGVTDNAGASVKKAIEDLKIKGVSEVRSGRKFIIEGNLNEEAIVNITTGLLANGVVEEYKIHGK